MWQARRRIGRRVSHRFSLLTNVLWIADVSYGAIGTDQACQAHVATRTTVVPARSRRPVSLPSFCCRNTGSRIARKRLTVAGVTRAVGIGLALQPRGASTTSAAAAVDVSFGAVFIMVGALIRIAPERLPVAGVTGAVGIDLALQPRGASTTSAAAAVDVGFGTVLFLVRAQTARASARYIVAEHLLLQSSVLARHFFPTAQAPQVPPPQSMSVSAPSCLWSVHRLLTHLDVTKSQALLAQAGLLEQNPPIGAPTQAPLLQVCPLTQAMPHPPQLLGSVWVFVQKRDPLPPHNVCPGRADDGAGTVRASLPGGADDAALAAVVGIGIRVHTYAAAHRPSGTEGGDTDAAGAGCPGVAYRTASAAVVLVGLLVHTDIAAHHLAGAGQPDTQTPLVHVPLEHCAADVQAPPADASPQPPSMQGVPLVQAVPHAPQLEESAEVLVQNPLQVVPAQASVSPAACILYSTSRLASAPVLLAPTGPGQMEPVRSRRLQHITGVEGHDHGAWCQTSSPGPERERGPVPWCRW